MSRFSVFVITTSLFSVSCVDQAQKASPQASPAPGVSESILASPQPNPTAVSLLQLIARPSDYDGQAIRVIGFAHLEFEGHGLYFHREDFEQALFTNAVWIDVDLRPEFKALNGRYVIVEGVFEAKPMGHSGAFRGAIQQISRYDPMPTRADLDKLRGAPQ